MGICFLMIFFDFEIWEVQLAIRFIHLQILPPEIQQIGWRMRIGVDFGFDFVKVWTASD